MLFVYAVHFVRGIAGFKQYAQRGRLENRPAAEGHMRLWVDRCPSVENVAGDLRARPFPAKPMTLADGTADD